jgi:hypothetical protein
MIAILTGVRWNLSIILIWICWIFLPVFIPHLYFFSGKYLFSQLSICWLNYLFFCESIWILQCFLNFCGDWHQNFVGDCIDSVDNL